MTWRWRGELELAQWNKPPIYFSIGDLQPSHTRWCALICARDTTGIQKQNIPTSFISRHMRVTMHENINIVRRTLRRDVLQPELQTAPRKIDNQRPIEIAVAISAHDHQRASSGAQFVQDPLRANVADMPDLVRFPSKTDHLLRQLVVRVGQHKDAHLVNFGTADYADNPIYNRLIENHPFKSA
jgi:hypothetical protein